MSNGCIPPPLSSLIIVQPGQGGIVSPLSQIGCRLHPIPPCGRPCHLSYSARRIAVGPIVYVTYLCTSDTGKRRQQTYMHTNMNIKAHRNSWLQTIKIWINGLRLGLQFGFNCSEPDNWTQLLKLVIARHRT